MPKVIGEITLYSVLELSQRLGVTVMTLRSYLKQGKIKGSKIGQKWWVSEKALAEFFEGGNGNGGGRRAV